MKPLKQILLNLFLILGLLILSGLMIVPNLNENQTLYISSTLAQVTATLFGLVITAYVFLEGKLTKDAENDESLIDVNFELKKTYRKILLLGGILTGFALLFCIVNIMIGDYSIFINDDSERFNWVTLFLNGSILFSVASIVNSLFFTYKATDPNRIKNASKKGIKSITKEKQNNTQKENNDTNYLSQFMIDFNKLENRINSFVEDDSANQNIKQYSNGRSIANKNIYYLRNNAIINDDIFKRIFEMRRYRNFLIHGDTLFVDENTYNFFRKLIDETENILNSYENKKRMSDN